MADVHPLLEETCDLLAALLAGSTSEQVMRHPANDPARWSAYQVVEHLRATWNLTINGLEDRLRKGRPLKTRPTLRQRSMQFAVCRCGFFPSGRTSPAAVTPSPEPAATPLSGDDLVASIRDTLTLMDTTLNRIEPEAKGGVPVLTHIVLGPLNVWGWRRFHRTHARHHLRQIRSAIGS